MQRESEGAWGLTFALSSWKAAVMTMEEERGEGGVGGGEGEEVDAVSDREAQEVRPEAFPRKNFISSIELLQPMPTIKHN